MTLTSVLSIHQKAQQTKYQSKSQSNTISRQAVSKI